MPSRKNLSVRLWMIVLRKVIYFLHHDYVNRFDVSELCSPEEACQCLQDVCTQPWYVKGKENCRSDQDCEDTVVMCAGGQCLCFNSIDMNGKKQLGRCGKVTKNRRGAKTKIKKKPGSGARF